VVVFVTGLPSSGKSTLARGVEVRLREVGLACARLDGDEVRDVLVPRPGYSEAERGAFYATLAGLAALLAGQGLVVVVAATANQRAYRERARERAPRFVEVWVDVSVAECRRRDTKGLFAAFRRGEVSSVPGEDAAYEPPLAPDVVARGGADEAAVERVIAAIQGPVAA